MFPLTAVARAVRGRGLAAWRALPGCESPQPDPYTAAFVDSLFTSIKPRQRLRWAVIEDLAQIYFSVYSYGGLSRFAPPLIALIAYDANAGTSSIFGVCGASSRSWRSASGS